MRTFRSKLPRTSGHASCKPRQGYGDSLSLSFPRKPESKRAATHPFAPSANPTTKIHPQHPSRFPATIARKPASKLGQARGRPSKPHPPSFPRKRESKRAAMIAEGNPGRFPFGPQNSTPSPSPPIVILSRFQTPAPNKASQPKCLGNPHETWGVQDDNLCSRL